MDFYDAWKYLTEHPAFNIGHFGACFDRDITAALDIMVVKVDPSTDRREDDESRNTQTQVWLECGPWIDSSDGTDMDPRSCVATHDPRLDCGAPTFEEAIVELAELVGRYYPVTDEERAAFEEPLKVRAIVGLGDLDVEPGPPD